MLRYENSSEVIHMPKIKTANRLEKEIYSMTNNESTYSMGYKKSKEVTYNNFT